MLNVEELLNEGATAIVDDSFTKCFKSTPSDPWNWNVYLFPMWCVGCLIRHLVLFPLRCAPRLPRPPNLPRPEQSDSDTDAGGQHAAAPLRLAPLTSRAQSNLIQTLTPEDSMRPHLYAWPP
jgi:hypothetical protein